MINIDAEKMAPVVNQIVENEGTQYFSVPYNKHKIVYSRAFVWRSWISLVSFFSDIFASEDAAFAGLSSSVITFVGKLHFEVERVKILCKNVKNLQIF